MIIRRALWAAVALAIAVADALIKSAVVAASEADAAAWRPPGIPIAPFVNLVYAENTGIAFGLFAGGGGRIFLIAAVAAVAAVVAAMLWRRAHRPAEAAAYALLLGGALGNLQDRIRNGHVVDFIDVHAGGWHWPAFNLADSAISGAALLLIATLFRRAR